MDNRTLVSKEDNRILKTFGYKWLNDLPLEIILRILKDFKRLEVYNLALVCKSWRKSILNMPILWSEINLNFETNPDNPKRTFYYDGKHYAEYTLKLHLNRARSALRCINLKNCPKLEYTWFKELKNFHRPKLNSLKLINTKVTFTFFSPLIRQYKNNITKLTLSNCNLVPEVIHEIIIRCQNLTYLDISNNKELNNYIFFTQEGKLIKPLETLRWLDVSYLNLNSIFISNIHSVFPNLTGINLNFIPNLQIEVLRQICTIFQSLDEIELAGLTKPLGSTINPLLNFRLFATCYPNLRRLNLSKSTIVNDHVICCFKDTIENLEELNLTQTFITARCLTIISRNCKKLQKLMLGSCPYVTYTALAKLYNPESVLKDSLYYLDISRLNIEDDIIYELIINLNLTYLDMNNCPKASNLGLEKLLKLKFISLNYLNLKYCRLVSVDCVSKLKDKFKNCEILFCLAY